MAASRSAQLAQPYLEQPRDAAWRRRRLELLKPEQEQRLAKRRWEAAPYVLLVAMIFVAAFAYMCLDAKIGLAGREINALNTQIKENQTLARRAELDIGSLSSLARIESYAKLHLNMVYPDIGAVHYLDQHVSSRLAAELAALEAIEAEAAPPAESRPWLAILAELINGQDVTINNERLPMSESMNESMNEYP
jgi:cell division protein FtsL